ncbi:MAG: hypothetical protein MPEBLZ_01117 [Candidatus Methanoperedens nitroreducens]|uniref:Uncharacterized protein n=1 Tax=Candidatus Methanoperedens nitratireducens TaxID=1392998 RepID=A0A0P7ZK18_9EURY|nr:hypothetical protein [Candidatus Methanoperedens sp. BLZ2]KAB2946982.1 MAG: hypothetical protein F9K14_05975 [Candidatus Methanoperedens sp.]KPQ44257.1 MAG: hypothetical protein MPEBLZ_01117 [Candidatus Methanoperedens sp. BLZ1]MBZ0176784.1 hypothetical protein [Candidatus Methanoperedens nitroreducens]MCX9080506.1 hypothetical protein [Candidatus Methanoperedens sp.]MCX9088276.1 hypothetical protein [Candidatus Methanoperedens sp.]
MAKEFIREIKGHKYKYLLYWGKAEKKSKQKYLGRVDIEKSVIMKTPTEKEVAEAITKIGGGLIERKHLEKWIKRLKIKENMDILRNLFVEQ